MDDPSWRTEIAGDRMQVDREFAERVRESEFSSQEWNLIMTAVEFEIEGEGDSARLVADTSRVESVLPELERMSEPTPMTGDEPSPGGGLLDSIAGALGLGSGGDGERLAAAVDLADEYAAALQTHLEEEGKWADLRRRA